MTLTKYKLGELIEQTFETNSDGIYIVSDVKGMTITKEIIPTKADVSNTDLSKFIVVKPSEFIFKQSIVNRNEFFLNGEWRQIDFHFA